MALFEVAVLLKPTPAEVERGDAEKLLLGPKAVVAGDAQSAAIAAVLEGDELKSADRSRLQVLVRPFA